MNRFVKFFHEMFNPHCEHCLEREELSVERQLVEFLMQQTSINNEERRMLINKLVNTPEPITEIRQTNNQPIRTSPLTWGAKRQSLELEDRAKAEALKRSAKPDNMIKESTDKLEEALGIKVVNETTEDKLNNEDATGTV